MSSPWTMNETELRVGRAPLRFRAVTRHAQLIESATDLLPPLAEIVADYSDIVQLYRAENAAHDLDESKEAGLAPGWNCAVQGPVFAERLEEAIPVLNYSVECLSQPRFSNWLRAIVRAAPYSYTLRVTRTPRGHRIPKSHLVQVHNLCTITVSVETGPRKTWTHRYSFTSRGAHAWNELGSNQNGYLDPPDHLLNDDEVVAKIEQIVRRPRADGTLPTGVDFRLTTQSQNVNDSITGKRERFFDNTHYTFERPESGLQFWVRGDRVDIPPQNGLNSLYHSVYHSRAYRGQGDWLTLETWHALIFELPPDLESLEGAEAAPVAVSQRASAAAEQEDAMEPPSKRRKTGGAEARRQRDTDLWY